MQDQKDPGLLEGHQDLLGQEQLMQDQKDPRLLLDHQDLLDLHHLEDRLDLGRLEDQLDRDRLEDRLAREVPLGLQGPPRLLSLQYQ